MSNKNKTIIQLFAEQVKKTPDNIAIICEERSITYQELNEKTNQLAHYICKQYKNFYHVPLTPDTLIAVYQQRNIEVMICIIAILKAGAAYVPLDPHYPKARIGYMLENSQAQLILTQERFTEELDVFSKQSLLCVNYIFVDGHWPNIAKESIDNLEPIAKANNLAYVIYTSGSTGTPKGVLIKHKGVASLILDTAKTIIPGDFAKVLQIYSVCFDVSVWVWTATLTRGATLVILSEQELPPYKEIADVLEKKQVNIAPLPPTLLEMVPPDYDLPKLKTIVVSGEKCPQSLVDTWAKNKIFINAYGPTETTIFSTIAFCQPSQKVTIGNAVANTKIYILDKNLNPTPQGEIGELYIGGIGVARGYLNKPNLTKERFFTYQNSRVYKTGDLVRFLLDGNLDFIGREDQQIKIRGYRVELGEIEDTLCKQKDIAQAVVNVWQKDLQNENEKTLVAYYSSKTNQTLNHEKLRKHLRQFLPEYMLPAFFIFMEEFPLTPNKKIDRKNLPVPFTTPSSTIESTANNNDQEIENKLCKIWSELLKIPKTNFTKTDNFFALGGNSLLTARMLLAIKKELNLNIQLMVFLNNPTIANIAQCAAATSDKINTKNTAQNLCAKLAMDSAAADTIIPHTNTNPDLYNPCVILLTGATGFLGIHLLNTLLQKTSATVYCLVRGGNLDTVDSKLKQNIHKHKLEHLSGNPRVKIIIGDLEKPILGIAHDKWLWLATNVDSIYHCGAYVHHVYDYDKLFKANVQSTIELLKLSAENKNKAFHFVSTISSISAFDEYGYATENGPSELSLPVTPSGYALTKMVAERILWRAQKRGFNITIYRPGNITGDTTFGICHPEQNHLLLLLKSCIQLGIVPNIDNNFEALPVDVLANSIIALSLQQQKNGRVFNLHHPYPTVWRQFIAWIQDYGFDLKYVQPEIWRQQLQNIDEKNALFSLLVYYINSDNNEIEDTSKIRYHKTQKILAAADIIYPKVDKDYVFKCVDYLVQCDFLKQG